MADVFQRHFTIIPIYIKRGRTCKKRTCDRVPQWSESKRGGTWGFFWCDEHAMERARKMFGLTQLVIGQPEKTVTGKAR